VSFHLNTITDKKIEKMKNIKIISIYLISIFVITSLIAFCRLVLPIENFFSENSSFYFFSSLLQANAAILSIVGVFFIFRIQSLQSAVDVIKSNLLSDRGHSSWPNEIIEWDNFSIREKESKLKNDKANKSILTALQTWTTKERHIYNLKKEIILPSLLLGGGIILETISLFSSYYLHKYYLELEFYISFINLLLELFIIIFVIRSIIKILK
jgi:hypothetical protein